MKYRKEKLVDFEAAEENLKDIETDMKNEKEKSVDLEAVEENIENIRSPASKKIKICSNIDIINDQSESNDADPDSTPSEEDCDKNSFSSYESLDENDEDTDDDSSCADMKLDGDEVLKNEPAIIVDLRKWFHNFPIVYAKLDALLRTLKPYHPQLPITSATLLKRSALNKYKIETFNPDDSADKSEFVYIGIAQQLQRTVNTTLHINSSIDLQFLLNLTKWKPA